MPENAEKKDSVGLIAGGGALPFVIAGRAAKLGRKVFIAGLEGFVDAGLASQAERFARFKPGHLQACIDFLKGCGACEVVFCGHIDHREVFASHDFDELMTAALSQSDNRADSLLGRIASAVEAEGLPVASLRDYLGGHIAGEGVLGSVQPTDATTRDLEFGWPLAAELAGLNIGQAVMIRGGVVIAVEAVEGTDAMIRRGGELAGPGATVIKLPLKDKDPRFDLPVVGSKTIKTMAAMGALQLSFAAGETIIIDTEEFIRSADAAGIAVVSKPFKRSAE
jgi:DUF1009 family protein